MISLCVHVCMSSSACAPSCPLDSVSPQQLEMATVTRGPGWVYGTEDGSFGTTEIGRVVNATYFRETGQAIIQWINQAVRVYPVTRVPNVLCFVFREYSLSPLTRVYAVRCGCLPMDIVACNCMQLHTRTYTDPHMYTHLWTFGDQSS